MRSRRGGYRARFGGSGWPSLQRRRRRQRSRAICRLWLWVTHIPRNVFSLLLDCDCQQDRPQLTTTSTHVARMFLSMLRFLCSLRRTSSKRVRATFIFMFFVFGWIFGLGACQCQCQCPCLVPLPSAYY